MAGRVKIVQKGDDIYFTCYGKVLAVNGFITMAYFSVVPSIKDEVYGKIRQASIKQDKLYK